jgi:hypothetical protein
MLNLFLFFAIVQTSKNSVQVKQKQQELYLNYTSTFVSHSHKIDPDKFYRKTVVGHSLEKYSSYYNFPMKGFLLMLSFFLYSSGTVIVPLKIHSYLILTLAQTIWEIF